MSVLVNNYKLNMGTKSHSSFQHFNFRGIKQSDTALEIKKAYRKAALRHHPDKVFGFNSYFFTRLPFPSSK